MKVADSIFNVWACEEMIFSTCFGQHLEMKNGKFEILIFFTILVKKVKVKNNLSF